MERIAIGLLLAKAEGTYGVDPTPTALANTMAVVGTPSLKISSTRVSRKLLDGGKGRLPGSNVQKMAEVSFRMEVRGNRTDGTAADISKGVIANAIEMDCLLLACDLAATYSAETTLNARDGYVTYKPTEPTNFGSSVTFYLYSHLKLHKVTGAKGTFKVTFEAGKMAYIDYTFKGFYNAVADATFPTTQTFLDTKPPLFVSSGSTYDSYAAIFSKAEFDLGNDIQPVYDANSANGIKGFVIANRDSKGSFDPESVAEATHPFWADWDSDEVDTFLVQLANTQTGNKFYGIFVTQLVDINYSERNGQRVHSATFEMTRTQMSAALGSEFQLKFA
jgi:hypothetical protein